MLEQAGITMRAGNFLGCLRARLGLLARSPVTSLGKRIEFSWIAMLVGAMLPYSLRLVQAQQALREI